MLQTAPITIIWTVGRKTAFIVSNLNPINKLSKKTNSFRLSSTSASLYIVYKTQLRLFQRVIYSNGNDVFLGFYDSNVKNVEKIIIVIKNTTKNGFNVATAVRYYSISGYEFLYFLVRLQYI